jgi:RNA polymerase sigma-70 factor (ECF subfamily)
MSARPDSTNHVLEQYRAQLECLALIKIDPRLRAKFGMSDIVQQTLLEAFRCMDQLRSLDDLGTQKWLRRMLLNNLLDEIEKCRSPRRDYRREQPLEIAAAQSSARLREWLEAEDTSPSEQLQAQEQAARLLDALARLPDREREALVLQKWHGWRLTEIADHMGCSAGAVAGLHARGLKRLRELLPESA